MDADTIAAASPRCAPCRAALITLPTPHQRLYLQQYLPVLVSPVSPTVALQP